MQIKTENASLNTDDNHRFVRKDEHRYALRTIQD